MKYELMPTILVPSRLEFEQRLGIIQGKIPIVQIDIADGEFVKNTSFANAKIAVKYNIGYEMDLMVKDPWKFIKAWKKVKTVRRAILHTEIEKPLLPIIKKIKALGWEAGLAFSPDTDWTKFTHLFPYLDEVLIMAVYPGRNGAPFVPKVVPEIKKLHKAYPKLTIAVDGSVNKKTLPRLMKAGATRFAVGSAIWNTPNPIKTHKEFLKLINKYAKTS